MLTNQGKTHIKRYLAGMNSAIGRSVAFGIGDKAMSATDTRLQFEAGRSSLTLRTYDFVNDGLVFKASVPDGIGGVINEIALFSDENDAGGQFESGMLFSFTPDTEYWTKVSDGSPADFVATHARLGTESLSITASANGNASAALTDFSLDLDAYLASDTLSFALKPNTANVSSVRFRFMTDASNYYEFSVSPTGTNYQIITKDKSTATVTGSPSWSDISELRVILYSTAGGASTILLDGIRIDSNTIVNDNYVMISRIKLDEPFIKRAGMTKEVEFYVDVSI